VLALTDSGLGYLVLAAARMPVHARDRWLQRLAQRLDPEPRPLTRQGDGGSAGAMGAQSIGRPRFFAPTVGLGQNRVVLAIFCSERPYVVYPATSALQTHKRFLLHLSHRASAMLSFAEAALIGAAAIAPAERGCWGQASH
jgi:hypothetical protein